MASVVHRCGSCPRTWNSYVECHCSACHRQFTGITTFDMHRSGGECRKPERLRDEHGNRRLFPYDRVDGVVWGHDALGVEDRQRRFGGR